LQKVAETSLGKTILISSREEWTNACGSLVLRRGIGILGT
jgi:hypothetical protein